MADRSDERKRNGTVLFAVVALVILAFTIYSVLISHDLTALLLGLLIVFIIYGLCRLVGRYGHPTNEFVKPLDSKPVEDSPSVPAQLVGSPPPITINGHQVPATPPPAQILRRCAHCGAVYPERAVKCPSCGAPF